MKRTNEVSQRAVEVEFPHVVVADEIEATRGVVSTLPLDNVR